MSTVADQIELFDDGTTLGDVLGAMGYIKTKEKRPRGRPRDIVDEKIKVESAKKHYEAVRRANKKYYETHREAILEKLRHDRLRKSETAKTT